MTNDYDLLLLPVFEEMRRSGADVSLTEYLQAIEMLRSGVGLTDADTLESTCRLLWAKSRDEQIIFDIAFAEKAMPILALLTSPSGPGDTGSGLIDDSALPQEDEEKEPQPEAEPQEHEGATEGSYVFPLPSSLPVPVPPAPRRNYHFIPRPPLSKNEMSGQWRQLRRTQPIGPVKEVDIERTIRDICHYGVFRGPIMQHSSDNSTRLLLLLDQGGSMVPFKLLIEALVESVIRNNLIGKTTIYYFHDYPGRTLYEDKHLGQPVSLEEIFAKQAGESRVLIVSDAGAARAHYDDERVRRTQLFVKLIRNYTYLYAWLNPVPFSRWSFTTAEDIDALIPMFPLDRDGLNDAINILRGQPFPPGVSTHV